MGRLYIVTGAAGHLGGTVVQLLLARGEEVRALVLPHEAHLPPSGAELVVGDVRDKGALRPLFSNVGGREVIVIHCAGIVTIASKCSGAVRDVNVTGTKNVIELCAEYGTRKLVHISSVHAIPEKPPGELMAETDFFDPALVRGLYAKTKAEATAYVLDAGRQSGLDVSVVHPSGICGPFDRGRGHMTALVSDFCRRRLTAAVNGGYDFVDVRDVAAGVVSCCEHGRAGECYILSNKYFTVCEILTMLHEITGVSEIKTYLPMWFARAVSPLAETWYSLRGKPPLFTPYSLYTLTSNSLFSHAKADAELNYTVRDMRETLIDTVEWLKSEGRI